MTTPDPFAWIRDLGILLISVAVGLAVYTAVDWMLS